MQLSVIIVNYNVRAFLENALVSVYKALGGITGEVIVVDNASDDGSVEMVRQKFPDVKLFANEHNLGFAAANNIGMKAASGEFILLLNPDTIVQEDTFKVMIDVLDNNEDVGLAGCKILNPDGTLQLACRRSFPTPWIAFTKIIGLSALFPKSRLFSKYNLEYLNPDESYEVDAVSGSFMFLRRSVMDRVGGLDEQFFMYGEDLDWSYRVKREGWKIYYVHSTQIVHYKGQSVRRSDIDEVKLFYEAMRVFVQKYFSRGIVSDLVLRFGIVVREWAAFLGRAAKPLRATFLDLLLIDASFIAAEFIWFGEFFRFPHYAYQVIFIVPWLILAITMQSLGVYTTRKLSSARAASSVLIGYVLLSALTFFFKQYGFSRMVVVISGSMNLILLPGWRLLARTLLRSPEHHRKSLFGRRTVIVGLDASGQAVLQKLRARIDGGYNIVGFIDLNRKRLGEKVAGVEILGSIDNIGKVIEEQRVTEVIFSTNALAYSDILSVIGRSRSRSVNFRLVPSSLEVIIGKTHIDELGDLPLVDIDYSISRPLNKFLKRLFDIVFSFCCVIFIYPFIAVRSASPGSTGSFTSTMLLMPKILRGEMSFVGPEGGWRANGSTSAGVHLGKPGVTGLARINARDGLTREEVDKYNLYYAKNQSLLLDIEILMKSVTSSRQK